VDQVKQMIRQTQHCLSVCKAAGISEVPPRDVLSEMLDAQTVAERRRIADRFAVTAKYKEPGSLARAMR
jgi:hypothetical protein